MNNYFFFRTNPPNDDPPVYAYEHTRSFFKLADSFSEFLELCAQDKTTTKAIWDQRHQTAYYFSENEFHLLPPVDYSLLPERLLETLRAEAPDMTIRFRGCSEDEVEALRAAQQVDRLPDAYRRVMRVMGTWGLGALLGGFADVRDKLENQRSHYIKNFNTGEKLAYPPDLFVFWGDSQACGCYFFRTSPGNDDPPVYMYLEERVSGFHKMAESFTDFMVWNLHQNFEEPDPLFDIYYRFDPDQDDFILYSPPSE